MCDNRFAAKFSLRSCDNITPGFAVLAIEFTFLFFGKCSLGSGHSPILRTRVR